MTIYIKECAKMNLDTVRHWFKKNISIKPFISLDTVKINDLVVISNTEDDDFYNNNRSYYNIIAYEDFSNKIVSNINQEFQNNYDYYYLKNALSAAADPNITTIIAGSSYGTFGVETSLLPNAVNLSLASEDLYYSLEGFYYTYSKNKNIKNLILCASYYYFFCDLSKTQNPAEIKMVSNVFHPIYADKHNCYLLPNTFRSNILYDSDIFDIQNILNIYTQGEYIKGYFHNQRPRKNFALKMWNDQFKDWDQLSINEKEEAAKLRASQHNKSIKRNNSLLENIELFKDFLKFCDSENINFLLVVTPSTSCYLNYLLPDFKSTFYNVLNDVDGVIHLLDLSEDTMFLDEDFNDTDHLSDKGAQKLTQIILNTLQEINNS